MKFSLKNLKPDTTLWLLLAVWWLVNILQAAFTGLADDEAYYFMFSRELAWGYFDHPPLTALLVRMGSIFGGELGVRFLFTLLQPLYIYIFWQVIKPARYEVRDVVRYVLICAAMPILQLYGFIAVPDGPLMLFTALLLLCYKRFTEDNRWSSALMMGVVVGLLAYSKYHGALVCLLIVVSNLKILKNVKFYGACLVALVVMLPHLYWQYQNEWVSFVYHLAGRNRDFQIAFVSEYLLNLFAIFNPFLLPIAIIAWWKTWKTKSKTPVERAVNTIGAGFVLFFLASTLRGYVQPQWDIPATFTVIALLYGYSAERAKLQRYIVRVSWITLALVALLRVEMIFNPLGIKFQIFDNEESYAQIEELADGRPVIFDGRYTDAAKYLFYTEGATYAQPTIHYRTSHYQLKDEDTKMAGGPAIIEDRNGDSVSQLMMANGREFRYKEVDKFVPTRKIEILPSPMPTQGSSKDEIRARLRIVNPYKFSYDFDDPHCAVYVVWRRVGEKTEQYKLDVKGVLEPESELGVEVRFFVPDLKKREYELGFIVNNEMGPSWFNSKRIKFKVN